MLFLAAGGRTFTFTRSFKTKYNAIGHAGTSVDNLHTVIFPRGVVHRIENEWGCSFVKWFLILMVKNYIEQLTSLTHHFIEDLNTFLKTLPEHLF